VIDIGAQSPITDFVVVASATSPPHLKALHGEITRQLRQTHGKLEYRQAGDESSAWIVLDFFDVIVHLFLPEAREYYDIEGLWDKGREIPLS